MLVEIYIGLVGNRLTVKEYFVELQLLEFVCIAARPMCLADSWLMPCS